MIHGYLNLSSERHVMQTQSTSQSTRSALLASLVEDKRAELGLLQSFVKRTYADSLVDGDEELIAVCSAVYLRINDLQSDISSLLY
ncbi:hypothetical protein EBQ34_14210 [Vandammella animalimorsus]|uniref:Uncharacterized protein n=1 Tax=Vandammella animalimorsus TaxID=2029117 RepID=A0A3M6R1A7_9BURK|nr:hypothetical protein [Vandammella animalimorsus]RMX09029.1 hypothetical protein EBQ34_14150 [Vandammella animalimorsus]RMX09040.1 hypothetical protein EBQ34_14210 [Vandammella animalimorsus]